MAQWEGSQAQIVLIEETTLGTTPGTPTGVVLPKSSVEPLIGRKLVDNPTIPGDRLPQKKLRGRLDAGCRLQVPLHFESAGHVLKHAIATPTSSGTGPHTHTGTVGGALPEGAEIEIQQLDALEYLLLKGLRADTFGLKVADTGALIAELDFPGLDYDSWSGTATVAAPTEYSAEEPLDLTYATINIDSVAAAYLMGLQLNVAQGVDKDKYTAGNNGKRFSLARGMIAVTGSMDFLVLDTTLIAKAEQSQVSTFDITVNQGTDKILTLTVTNAQLTFTRHQINDAGAETASLDFAAYGSAALAYSLTNTTASY